MSKDIKILRGENPSKKEGEEITVVMGQTSMMSKVKFDESKDDKIIVTGQSNGTNCYAPFVQTMKLVSMTDYILEQIPERICFGKLLGTDDVLKEITNYARFLKQPLTLGMFVPCDLESNVLEKPKQYEGCLECGVGKDLEEALKYQEAQQRVLFKGFELSSENAVTRGDLTIYLDTMQFTIEGPNGHGGGDIYGDDVEALAKANLDIELTETAIKQIEG